VSPFNTTPASLSTAPSAHRQPPTGSRRSTQSQHCTPPLDDLAGSVAKNTQV